MQIKVSGTDLSSALNVVSLCVNSKDDTSSHFLFRYKGGSLQVLSYSSRVFSLSPIIAEVEAEEGESFTVEAWRLNKWVNSVGHNGVFTLTSNESGEVTAKSGKSKLKFRSLDPSRFRTWDKVFDSSKVVGKVSPVKLSEALMVSKLFVSQDDTIKPQYCQVVSWDSTLISTNRRSMSAAVIPYPGLNFRIPSKDIGTLIKFLNDKNTVESELEVRESSRPKEEGGGEFDFFVRPDGSYFGSSRLSAKVVRLETPRRDTEVLNSVVLNVEEFKQAIEVLLASAPKGHDAVKIVSNGSDIVASMPSEAGGEDSYPFSISSYKGESSVTFSVEYSYLLSLADLFSTDTLTLGVFSAGDGGYLSLHHDDPVVGDQTGNSYSIGVLWKGT